MYEWDDGKSWFCFNECMRVFPGLKVVQYKKNYVYKNDFCWNRGGSLFKKQFDIKNRFCTNKGKGTQSRTTPTRTHAHDGTVVVSNSVNKEFGVKQTRSSSTLFA